MYERQFNQCKSVGREDWWAGWMSVCSKATLGYYYRKQWDYDAKWGRQVGEEGAECRTKAETELIRSDFIQERWE